MSSGNTLQTVAALAAGYYFITAGGAGTLPSGIQKIYNELLGTGSTAPAAPGAPSAAPPVTGAPTAAQIVTWAQNIGVDPCVGRAFVKDNGVLPSSLDILHMWGTSTGRWNSATGAWSCKVGD